MKYLWISLLVDLIFQMQINLIYLRQQFPAFLAPWTRSSGNGGRGEGMVSYAYSLCGLVHNGLWNPDLRNSHSFCRSYMIQQSQYAPDSIDYVGNHEVILTCCNAFLLISTLFKIRMAVSLTLFRWNLNKCLLALGLQWLAYSLIDY